MLTKAITDANESFAELGLPHRLTEDVNAGEDVYCVFMAKKKNGQPKDDYPSKLSALLTLLRLRDVHDGQDS